MKKILVILMLLSSALGLRAQGSISDPFFNHGQARSLNSRIIAPLQPVPGFVNQAIAGMLAPNNSNIARLAHLKDDYGYAVWDQAKTFTAAGRETALIPMVRPEEDAITGILVAIKDGSTFRYGVMDTKNPFPYASAAPGTPGMPSLRDVLALSVLFNRTLFGEVDCNLVQALRALSNNNVRGQTAGSPKSCYVQTTYAGQNCDHIYGTYPDGTMQYLYSDCYNIYDYSFICDTDSADNDDGGSGGGGSGGGSGSSGPGDSNGEENNNENPCNHAEVPTCSYVISSRIPFSPYCQVNVRISGCNLQNHSFFLTGMCTHPFSPSNNQLEIQNTYVYTFLTSTTNAPSEWDPNCNRTTERCGVAFVSFTVVTPFWGVHTGESQYEFGSSFCYKCVDCV